MSKHETKSGTDEKLNKTPDEKPVPGAATSGHGAAQGTVPAASNSGDKSTEVDAELAQLRAERDKLQSEKQEMEESLKAQDQKLKELEVAKGQSAKAQAEKAEQDKLEAESKNDPYAKPGKMVKVQSATDYSYNVDGVIVDKIPKTLLRYTGNYLDSQMRAGVIEEA